MHLDAFLYFVTNLCVNCYICHIHLLLISCFIIHFLIFVLNFQADTVTPVYVIWIFVVILGYALSLSFLTVIQYIQAFCLCWKASWFPSLQGWVLYHTHSLFLCMVTFDGTLLRILVAGYRVENICVYFCQSLVDSSNTTFRKKCFKIYVNVLYGFPHFHSVLWRFFFFLLVFLKDIFFPVFQNHKLLALF